MLLVVVAASSMLVTALINPIGQTSQQQQYVFAQENTIVSSSYNKTGTNATFSPQIHNYTSSPPGPVNSWIIESTKGVVVIDNNAHCQAKNLVDEIKKIYKPIYCLSSATFFLSFITLICTSWQK
jgi:hypothetical protein